MMEGKMMADEERKGFNQWRFVHTLLKSVVLNTITAINYLKLTPDSAAYVKYGRELNRAHTRTFYVAMNKAIDEWAVIKNVKDGRVEHLKYAVSMISTISDTDRAYNLLMETFIDNLKNMSPEEIEQYCVDEKPREVKQQVFIQKEKEEIENG